MGHRVLHQPTKPVGEVTAEVRDLVQDMFDTMAAADGVGLAANQVGVPLRLFVYDCPDDEGVVHRGCVLNPRLEVGPRPTGRPGEDDDEGCLSVPGEQFPTGRPDWARVTGTDLDGARGGAGGHRPVRPVPAARDRPPGRAALPRPPGRYDEAGRPSARSATAGGASAGS